jgi:hypothetical protein
MPRSRVVRFADVANRVFLSGVGTDAVQSEEKVCILLEIRTGSDSLHIKVVADTPLTMNFLRSYHSTRPIFVNGTLCGDGDGGLAVRAELVEYARPQNSARFNSLPLEKFVRR